MDPVQALAILSLGAFLTVLVTAMFYIFTVRPRLLEPVSLSTMGLLDEHLQAELTEQRAVVERLNVALAHHTEQLQTSAARALPGDQLIALHVMLRSQADTVEALNGLLTEHGIKLNGLEQRIEQIDDRLEGIPSAEDHGTLVALIQAQSEHLDRRLSEFSPGGDEALRALIQAQADRLLAISTRLDEWAAAQAREDERLAEHARLLAALDREMAEQAQIVQQLDARAGEHTTMLVTAANERREQAGRLDRTMQQLAQLFPLLNQLIEKPPRPGQDRLTDIIGIGPAFSGKLYEAGIHTFRQLAAMTPEEINTLINVPKWRAVDAESWIEQARLLASQREKVEHIT